MRFRAEDFEFDPRTGEVHCGGSINRLEPQPAGLLALNDQARRPRGTDHQVCRTGAPGDGWQPRCAVSCSPPQPS